MERLRIRAAGEKREDSIFPPISISLLFTLLAIFLSPFDVFVLNPMRTEVETGYARLNISAFDFMVMASFVFLCLERRKRELNVGIPFIWYMLFLIFGLISTFRAVDMVESLKHIIQYGYFFFLVLPLVSVLVDDERKLKLSAFALMSGLVLHLCASIYLYFTLGRVDEYQQISERSEFYGVGGLTRTALVGLPVFMAFMKKELSLESFGMKTVLLMALTVAFGTMGVLTYNRSAAGALVISLLFVLALPVSSKVNWKSTGARLMAVVSGGAILLLFFHEWLLPEELIRQYDKVFSEDPLSDTTFRWRHVANLAVIYSWRDTFFWGWGHDAPNIGARMVDYMTEAADIGVPHNVYITWWGGAGFLGMLSMLLALWRTVGPAFKVSSLSRDAGHAKVLLIGLLSAYLGLLGHYMLHASVFRRLDWTVVALIFCAVSLIERKNRKALN